MACCFWWSNEHRRGSAGMGVHSHQGSCDMKNHDARETGTSKTGASLNILCSSSTGQAEEKLCKSGGYQAKSGFLIFFSCFSICAFLFYLLGSFLDCILWFLFKQNFKYLHHAFNSQGLICEDACLWHALLFFYLNFQ